MEILTSPIFLLTDFGTRDHYVGQLKAVIASIAPRSPIVDISHGIEPFAIDEAAWMLEITLPLLPESALVVTVVDPGVGTTRRALGVCREGRHFFGPDNGVLSAVFRAAPGQPEAGCDIRELCDPQFQRPAVSRTFHGRDIFGPAAAWVASGLAFHRLGPPVTGAAVLAPFGGQPDGFGRLRGRIVHVDRYGNLVTTVRAAQLFPRFAIEVAGREVATHTHTFAEVPVGSLFCHVDSSGFLAVAVNQGNAAEVLGANRGDPVVVHAR